MEILLADEWGMCKGLRLIMHLTRQTLRRANDEQIYIYRSLVHNEQAHEALFDMGVRGIMKTVHDVPLGSTVIVGPHSASTLELEQLRNRATLVDTSCRDVIRVLDAARKHYSDGRRVVFVGLHSHEEAISILAEMPDTIIVSNESDVTKIPRDIPIALISQSTGTKELFNRVASTLGEKTDVAVDCTVCNETHIRQIAATRLAKKCDVVVVIGGRKSHNTNELVNTCRRSAKVYLVETANELETDWFDNTTTVGVTAGASTPDNIVTEVVQRLNEISALFEGRRSPSWRNRSRWFYASVKTVVTDMLLLVFQRTSSATNFVMKGVQHFYQKLIT